MCYFIIIIFNMCHNVKKLGSLSFWSKYNDLLYFVYFLVFFFFLFNTFKNFHAIPSVYGPNLFAACFGIYPYLEFFFLIFSMGTPFLKSLLNLLLI